MNFALKSRLVLPGSVCVPPPCPECGCNIPKCTCDPVPQAFQDALRDKFLTPEDRQVAEEYRAEKDPYQAAFPYPPRHLTEYKEANALGFDDNVERVDKLSEYAVPVFERHCIKTFGINCMRLDLGGKPPRYLCQAYTQQEDTSRWETAAVSIYAHIGGALRSDLAQDFGHLSYSCAAYEQCLQTEIVNLKRYKRLLKYLPIERGHPVWKAYDLVAEDMLTYNFDRLEAAGLWNEIGFYGRVRVMTLLIKVCRRAIADWEEIVRDLEAICMRHGVEFWWNCVSQRTRLGISKFGQMSDSQIRWVREPHSKQQYGRRRGNRAVCE